MTATCLCGHPRDVHLHHRSGMDCGTCGPQTCPGYHWQHAQGVTVLILALLVLAVVWVAL